MSNDLIFDPRFGTMAPEIANDPDAFDDLGSGIEGGYAVLGFRGKVWRLKHRKEERPLINQQGDPIPSVEAVIVASSHTKAKNYFPGGYKEGSVDPPVCWSTNAVTPDASVLTKQSATCKACPHDAIGSRITEDGKRAKACADSKRVAIVPAQDMDNEAFGGPMLLRIPAASLVGFGEYGDLLKRAKFAPIGVVTRIGFDISKAYPQLVFSAVRPLTGEEARKALEIRRDPKVLRILAEGTDDPQGAQDEPPLSQVFEQPPVQQPAPQPAPAPQQPVQTGMPFGATGGPAQASQPAQTVVPPTQPKAVSPLPVAGVFGGGVASPRAPVQTPAAPQASPPLTGVAFGAAGGPVQAQQQPHPQASPQPSAQAAPAPAPTQAPAAPHDPGPIPGFLDRTQQGNGNGAASAHPPVPPSDGAIASMEDALNASLNSLLPNV